MKREKEIFNTQRKMTKYDLAFCLPIVLLSERHKLAETIINLNIIFSV